jgi:RhtB (resistance to homoserine/threonine) family protein
MEFFFEWLIVFGISLVAMMSPGPDFVLAVRNSLVYSRRTGIFTAFGFALGVCVHVTYCIIGIAAVISQSIMLFNLIKYIGAGYLVYVGWHALRSHGFSAPVHDDETVKVRDISALKAVGMGFMTNVLNPKATMFFLALFTQVIDPHTPLAVQILYGGTAVILNACWFSLVAIVLTHKPIKAKFLSYAKWIDRVCGGLMIALGLKLALTKVAS